MQCLHFLIKSGGAEVGGNTRRLLWISFWIWRAPYVHNEIKVRAENFVQKVSVVNTGLIHQFSTR